MTAEIIILADYRARRVCYQLTVEPVVMWWLLPMLWVGFWFGGR